MKMYRSRTRQEVAGAGLRYKEFSENEQLFGDLIDRDEVNVRKKVDTQKIQSDIENKRRNIKK